MIKSFKHKGLKRFYATGDTRGIQTKHRQRLRDMLIALDTAMVIQDMDIPGYGLHSLQGKRRNEWSITVNGNWRLTFKFKSGDVFILNYEDYH